MRKIAASVITLAAANACANDFGVFTPMPDGGVELDAGTPPDDAGAAADVGAVGHDGSTIRDSGAADAGTDASCTPSTACLGAAQACALACDNQASSCLNQCNNNPCRNNCRDKQTQCKTGQGGCVQVCTACTQDAGCPAQSACSSAVN